MFTRQMGGQLAKNTLAQVVAKIIVVFVSLLLIRLITGALGKEGYGVYGFVTAVVLLFATIADWGTSIIAVREASQKKELQSKIFGAAFAAKLVLSLAVFFLINIFSRLYAPWADYVVPLTIGSFVLLFLSVKTSMNIVFQTRLRFVDSSLIEVAGVIIFALLAVLSLSQIKQVDGVIWAWVMSAAAAALLSLLFGLKLAKVEFGINQAVLKKIVSESLPMGLFLVFFSIYNRVDIIILEHFRGVGDVAVYNLAYKVHDNLVLGAAFLMGAAFPVISRIYANPDAQKMLMSFYKKLFGVVALGGALVAIIFFVSAPTVIQLLTGREFAQFTESVTALKILVFATFISYLNHLTGFSLIAFGKQKAILLVGTISLVFNVTANMIFIPSYSWTAAAIITVATEFIVLALTSYFVFAKIFRK